MAKVTITIEDGPRGTVDVQMRYEPPSKKGRSTPAQDLAIVAVNAMAGAADHTKQAVAHYGKGKKSVDFTDAMNRDGAR